MTDEAKEKLRRYKAEWNRLNADRVRASKQAWLKRNPERRRQVHADYYKRNPKAAAEWRKRNPERAREINRASKKRHSEQRKIYNREWRQRNKDTSKTGAAWRKNNPQRRRENEAKCRARNPGKYREKVIRYQRAKGSVNLSAHYEKILAETSHCIYCGVKLSKDKHVDHITPLSRGGKHEEENLVVSRACCNRRKSAKTLEEFAARNENLIVWVA